MSKEREIDKFYLLLYGVHMNKNKKIKLVSLALILLILIFCSKKILTVDILNYKIKYNNVQFNIREKYDNEKYDVEIKSKDKKYIFKLYNEANYNKKIVSKIYFYEDNEYECLLPIINNKVVIDMMCYKNNIVYNYSKIIGDNLKLDEYVLSVEEYDVNLFTDNISKTNNINTIKYYLNNKIENIVAITTYKGLIISGYNIDLFKTDVYNNKISTFVDKYYLIADYDNEYDFEYFYLVDIVNKTISKIKSKNEISLDSYIQGIVDNKVYIYDKDNQNQYEIDVKNKKINLISSENEVKYYKNNKWEKLNKIKANKEIYFDYTSLDNFFTDYDKVIESEDYYYLINNNGSNYDLYRVDKDNLEIYRFIGTIPTDLIFYRDNYIYYTHNNKLYYYSDVAGFRTILEDSELNFNNTIKYYIY